MDFAHDRRNCDSRSLSLNHFPAGMYRFDDVKINNIFGSKSDLMFTLKSSQADRIVDERSPSGFAAGFKSGKDRVVVSRFEAELPNATFLALKRSMTARLDALGDGSAWW